MGIDEAGRGALSGPLVVAGVVFKKGEVVEEARDSKLLSPKERQALYFEILRKAKRVCVGVVPPLIIDKLNIYNATLYGIKVFLLSSFSPDYLLLDALLLKDLGLPQIKLIKGERKSISIASASIVAKVTRDRIMETLHRFYPEYQWEKNKGYPTKAHVEALRRNGLTPFHRRSYKPCKI